MARIIKKPEERRLEIINAARYLFQTQEYDKTSMQDVMNYLNIAKGTIYHYFPSKESLLQAVIESIVDENIEQMEAVVEQASGTALEKIQMLMGIGNIAAHNEKILEHLHQQGNDIMHIRLLTAVLARQAPLYARLIQQGCDEGVFTTKVPLESAEFILYAVQFLTDSGIYPWKHKDLDRRAQAFPQLIEQLLKSPQGSFDFMIDAIQESGKCDCV
jgi:AcrR family transcriptional regulator